MQTIILGGGCFWCTESVFLSVKGVQSVVSGYMGGDAVSANYEAVCSGNTGHVEVIKVREETHRMIKSPSQSQIYRQAKMAMH